MTERSSLKRALMLVAVLPVLTVFALGCSSSSKTSSTATSSSVNGTSATSSSVNGTTATTSQASTSSDVSGTWTGHYSGGFSGTFTVTWTTSGSNLSGTIKISGFGNEDTPINGSLQGDQITFGTVGSQEITYRGSVSGSSMSGTWTVVEGGNTAGSGSWNATKS